MLVLLASLGRVVESHRSFHTDMDDPDSTFLISVLLTKDLAYVILRQPYDGKYEQISSKGDAFL